MNTVYLSTILSLIWNTLIQIWNIFFLIFQFICKYLLRLFYVIVNDYGDGDGKGPEAWHAAVHGVTKSQTWLSDWTTTKLIWDFLI